MNANVETPARIAHAIAALGPGALSADAIRQHVAPLFSRVLGANRHCAYLANHSLGRPLDATADDLAQAVGLWQSKLGDAWDDWLAEIGDYRARLAQLLGAPRADCVVPKTSAGQGLRAILNTYDKVPRVVATRGEFDSIDLILRQYARGGHWTRWARFCCIMRAVAASRPTSSRRTIRACSTPQICWQR